MGEKEAVLSVFLFAYLGLALGRYPLLKLDRTGISLVSAIFLLATGLISREEAKAAIDDSTIILLFALMLISGQLHIAGFYEYLAEKILHLSKDPKILLLFILLFSGFTSALFTNDVVCVAFTPVVLRIMEKAQYNPIPFLLAIAMGSNSGGVLTLIGNPQNILIGQLGNLSFLRYSYHMLLPTFWALLVNYFVIYFIYQKDLQNPMKSLVFTKGYKLPKQNEYLIRKTLFYTALMLGAFLLGFPRDIVALLAAALVLISRKTPAEKLYPTIDFKLLILFVSLFILTGSLETKGILQEALAFFSQKGINLKHVLDFSFISVILSNIVSNVPAVMLLKFVPNQNEFLWEVLAYTSTLAGNLTVLGSIANLIVLEKAREKGVVINFTEYFKVGFLFTAFSLPLGIFLLHLGHVFL